MSLSPHAVATRPASPPPALIARALRVAGLAGTEVSTHVLRHTFSSRLMEATGNPRLVQVLGGWASLAMVERYTHVVEGQGPDAIARVGAAREAATNPSVIPLAIPQRRVGGAPRTF